MAGLTVTEKQHWKDWIAARFEKRVEAIEAQHPALFDGVKRDAHAQSLPSLGLTEHYAKLETIKGEEIVLARRKQWAMLSLLRGVPLDKVGDSLSIKYGPELPIPLESHDAITKRREAYQVQLLADDPVGCEITRLEAEKDNLLDTVWLAVSPAQIKQLWSKVAELLNDEPTRLEREAMAIEPAREV